jgi:hypothetical protein
MNCSIFNNNSFVVLHLSRISILQGFTFIKQTFLKVIKDQGLLEVEGVDLGTSKCLSRTYFSL